MAPKPSYAELDQRLQKLEKTADRDRATIAKYRTLVDNSPDLLYRTDLQGIIVYISPSVQALSGYTVEEAIGMKMADEVYLVPEERNRFLTELQQQGVIRNFEARLKRKDGSIWWASTNAHFYKDENGNIQGVEGVTRDISELKAAEEAHRRERDNFRILVEASPFGMAVVDAENRFQYFNPRFQTLFGYSLEEVATTHQWFQVAYPDPAYRQEVKRALSSKPGQVQHSGIQRRSFRVRCKNGTDKEIQFRSVNLAGGDQLVLVEDITEQKKLEETFMNAQKMESIGTLAAGIAHDFNNLMTGILGNASLIKLDSDAAHTYREQIENIEHYVRRGADLTRQLLGLTKGGKYEVKPTDLNRLVENSATMFGRTKKEIQIHHRFTDELWTVAVDQNQIEQVLINLFVNAWQAMPGGGDLYIETRNIVLDDSFVVPRGLKAGRYVQIAVTDTGMGMDAATQQRVFDPFFTTKAMGRGTGLGLASAYGILKNHEGLITLYSEIGRGSTFKLYLPATDKPIGRENSEMEKPLEGQGQILLVDDEEMILDVGARILKRLKYSVRTATSGRIALEEIKRPPKVDLVILDMIMPGMNGDETYDRIKAFDPDVRVLLSSGYSLDGHAQEILDKGCDGFIQKPFNITELSQSVHSVLSENRHSDG